GRQAALVEIVERPAEIRIVPRAEQKIEHPARRAVLPDLLRERVLVEVEQDQDAMAGAEPHDGADAIEIRPRVLPAHGLESTPIDGETKEIEAQRRHARGIAVVEGRNRLERQSSVVEGDVEDAVDARVDAAKRDLAAQAIDEPAAVDAQLAAVDAAR